jgi:sugar/nucleoside kinase (ribokinase family)
LKGVSMKKRVVISGYVSLDHMIKIKKPAFIGTTSIVENKTNGQIYYGGCSINIGAALSKLGVECVPMIRVGEDYESTGLKAFLSESGIKVDGVVQVPEEATSTCYLIQDNHYDHITIFYPGAMDKKYAGGMSDSCFEGADLGVITVASLEDNREFYQKCKKHDIPVVFGMKEDSEAFPPDFLKELLLNSKIIFSNETERKTIEEILNIESITELFQQGKAEIIVTTYGKDGSVYYKKEDSKIQSEKIGITEVAEVIDATGSGDAYISGFLYGYLRGNDIRTCCELGGVLSSFVLQKEGCCTNLPDETQLMNQYKMRRE